MELSGSSIKKFLIFFQEKSFLLFQETELSYVSGNGNPEKLSWIFSKESCSYISENGNPEKIPYVSGNGNTKELFELEKIKSFSYFRR